MAKTRASQMAEDQNLAPQPIVTDQVDHASVLIGELQSDGTISIKAADQSQETASAVLDSSPNEPPTFRKAMAAALDSRSIDSSISTPSEEDYDSLKYEAATIIPGAKGAGVSTRQ